jgi:hypothetical protein
MISLVSLYGFLMYPRIGSELQVATVPTVTSGGAPALRPMRLTLFAMHVFVVVFFTGLAGSAVVVAISFVEDLLILLGLGKDAEHS